MENDKLARWLIGNVLACPEDYIFEEEVENEILEQEEARSRENNTIPRFQKNLEGKCYYDNCYECWKAFMEEVEKIRQKRSAK